MSSRRRGPLLCIPGDRLYTDAVTGYAALVYPTEEYLHTQPAAERQTLVNLIRDVVPAGAPHQVLPIDDLPDDGEFSAVWVYAPDDDPPLRVDMSDARTVWRNRIRRARTKLFPALDVAYMRALETGDHAQIQEVVARKQALRDLPADPEIEHATTTEALRALWPGDVLRPTSGDSSETEERMTPLPPRGRGAGQNAYMTPNKTL